MLANKEQNGRRRRPAGILDDMLNSRAEMQAQMNLNTNASSNDLSFVNLQKSHQSGNVKNSLQKAFRRKIARNTLTSFNETGNVASTIDLSATDNTSMGSGFHSARGK
jgi:hypothetical protein